MAAYKEKGQKEAKEAQSIVRLAGRDINGSMPIKRALANVKGIGANLANALSYAIEKELKISRDVHINELSEEQFEKVEKIIKNPENYGVPAYMLNQRKDFDTGKDMHVIGNDLAFAIRQNINRQVALRSWRGLRHQYGQKVRGQHTRSTGRTGATVGVSKKSA
ncbi:MAG: 30S ribosomal protein S13, partial [Candidatus Micrarchaeaceae archaeon]